MNIESYFLWIVSIGIIVILLREFVTWYYKLNDIVRQIKTLTYQQEQQIRLDEMFLKALLFGKEEIKQEYERYKEEYDEEI